MVETNLEYAVDEDRKIYEYLCAFYKQLGAPPDFTLVKEYFEKKDDIETVARLEEFKKVQSYIRTNFIAILRSERDQQNTKTFTLNLRDAQQIAEHGKSFDKPGGKKVILRGVNDALSFLGDKNSELVTIENGEKLEGDATEDADELIEEYEKTASSDKYADRNLFGFEAVDIPCAGHRAGEYWIHTAFTAELKSTLAINYFYNNAYIYGKNIFYAILEMTYKQIRRNLYTIHSSHGKFVTDWYREDVKRGVPEGQRYTGLDYRKVRDGELDEIGFKRLKIVAQDFKATRRGHPYIWRPEGDASPTIADIKRKAEQFHNKYGCDGIIIDHLGLVRPQHRTSDHVTSINSVIREGRMLALNFARGSTVPVLGLFQLNRQGKLRADKADGRYDISAISYANEVEKSADVISYTYLNDELRRQGKFYMGCMKNRENPIFERMVGKILWQSKRMRAIESTLLDMNTDRLKAAVQQISLSVEDMTM